MRTDVLVIGGGAAAARAAIAASESGVETTLACKGLLGKSGNSPMAPHGFAAAMGDADPVDSPSQHLFDTINAGRGLSEPELVRILATGAPQAVRELEEHGLRFDREGGGLAQAHLPGHSHRRGCHAGMHTGRRMMQVLVRWLSCCRTRVLEDHVALRLLVRSGTVTGATLLDLRTSRVIEVTAGAVVLATGGAGRLFRATTNSAESTGDGYALALKAGASLIDMEMVQFNPCGLLWPDCLRGVAAPAGLLMGHGGYLRNSLGERFMVRYDSANMENSTRDVLTRAVWTEIQEGRGTDRGGVFMDARHLSEEYLRSAYPGQFWYEYLRSVGLDLRREPMEVAPSAHHMMGGIAVNQRCETGITGLFAAGECSGGIHGANRLAGNALAETQVFGARAGRFAAAHSKGRAAEPHYESEAATDRETIGNLLASEAEPHKGRLRGWQVKERLQEIMSLAAAPIRSHEDLAAGLSSLADLTDLVQHSLMVASRSPVCNADLLEALEVRNMVAVADVVLRAAVARRESRGAHLRVDCPESSPEPVHHIEARLGLDGSVVVGARPVGRLE